MQRYALRLEYQGSQYAGWQRQPHAPSVQATLETALTTIANESIEVVCAGRTDTGVHAKGQVVHFDTTAVRPIYNWVRGLNAILPKDIAVNAMAPVRGDFHARFSASFRRYQYRILNQAHRSPEFEHRACFIHYPLAESLMQTAAQSLLGYHDFNAFRSSECQSRSSQRHVLNIGVTRQEAWLYIDITANAFLHHMVRNIAGCLIWVGRRKVSPEWLAEVLNGRDRTQAGPTAPAQGLYFIEVGYPRDCGPDFEQNGNFGEDFGYHLPLDPSPKGLR